MGILSSYHTRLMDSLFLSGTDPLIGRSIGVFCGWLSPLLCAAAPPQHWCYDTHVWNSLPARLAGTVRSVGRSSFVPLLLPPLSVPTTTTTVCCCCPLVSFVPHHPSSYYPFIQTTRRMVQKSSNPFLAISAGCIAGT